MKISVANWRYWLPAGLTLAVVLVAAALPPIAQPPAYHDFVDRRAFFGVANFLNVVSNLPFLAIGALGFYRLRSLRSARLFLDARERLPWVVFFLGIALVSLGSAWYHLAPDNARLFWDRLPMSLSFMALLSAVLVERLGPRPGLQLFPWLLALGPASVLYWIASEAAGAGDLRPYGVVHLYPMLLIPLLLALFPTRYGRGRDFLVALALYALALAVEWFDRAIYHALGQGLSGHTIKHLLAAAAAAWLLYMLLRRSACTGGAGIRGA